MKVTINLEGNMIVSAENEIELYALKKYNETNWNCISTSDDNFHSYEATKEAVGHKLIVVTDKFSKDKET